MPVCPRRRLFTKSIPSPPSPPLAASVTGSYYNGQVKRCLPTSCSQTIPPVLLVAFYRGLLSQLKECWTILELFSLFLCSSMLLYMYSSHDQLSQKCSSNSKRINYVGNHRCRGQKSTFQITFHSQMFLANPLSGILQKTKISQRSHFSVAFNPLLTSFNCSLFQSQVPRVVKKPKSLCSIWIQDPQELVLNYVSKLDLDGKFWRYSRI